MLFSIRVKIRFFDSLALLWLLEAPLGPFFHLTLPKIYYDIAFSSRFLEKNAENSLFFKFFSSPEDFWEKKRSGNGKGKASPVAPYIFTIRASVLHSRVGVEK